MNCEEMEELLKADYIDGELSGNAAREAAAHLSACARCRRFEEAVRRAAVAPLRGAPRERAPESLWRAIERAVGPAHPAGGRAGFRVTRHELLGLRGAAAAVAAAAAAVIIAVTLPRSSAPPAGAGTADQYVREQFLTLVAMGDGGAGLSDDGGSIGTVVEEYLL
ncbi:MAG: zf-HC2 domain-containing protein [bacterium]|nr:zf-HC2 domain-containing protein [bacterium]